MGTTLSIFNQTTSPNQSTPNQSTWTPLSRPATSSRTRSSRLPTVPPRRPTRRSPRTPTPPSAPVPLLPRTPLATRPRSLRIEHAREFALVLGADLVARDGLHQTGRAAHKQLDILLLGLGQDRLEEILADEATGAGPALGRLVEHVKGAEALGVRVLEVLPLLLEQNVLLRHVAKDERHLCLVVGVVEDGPRELVHGRDARAARNQRNVVVLVLLPLVFGQRALHVEPLAGLHVVEVRAHGPVGVLFDQQVNEALVVLVADGRVRPEGGLLVIGALVLGQDGTGDVEARDHVALGQLEAEALGVVVDILHLGQLQRDEALVAARKGHLGRRDGLDLGRSARPAKVVVTSTAKGSGTGSVEKGVGSALGCRLGGVATSLSLERLRRAEC